MASEQDYASFLTKNWSNAGVLECATDYTLLAEREGTYAARSRGGLAALVVPISDLGTSTTGRRAAGCELVGHSSLQFAYGGREWHGPAASLLCTDPDLIEAFAVLAADVVLRSGHPIMWQSLVAGVEEWQTLLRPRGRPSAEAELGLWGELWFLDRSKDIGRTLAGWRGPERDSIDFFIDGVGVEVKTGKTKRHHHVSQSQVDAPVGTHDAWLLSLWVKADPGANVTVGRLFDAILDRAPDRADALRRIAQAGFSPSDRREFDSSFAVLSDPEWYPAGSIPRVRVADAGISQLRYQVVLDEALSADSETTERLWRHFHGEGKRIER